MSSLSWLILQITFVQSVSHSVVLDASRNDGVDKSCTGNKTEEKKDKEPTSLLKKLLVQNKKDTTVSTKGQTSVSDTANQAASLPQTFSFPPALLAANPSLANAAPGSIVVVASPRSVPHEGQPGGSNAVNQQLLHVFMVSDEQNSSHSQNNEPNKYQRGEKDKAANRRLTSDSTR